MSHFDTILAMALAGEGGGGGASDFSTASVTISANSEAYIDHISVACYEDKKLVCKQIDSNGVFPVSLNVPLYKGELYLVIDNDIPDLSGSAEIIPPSEPGDVALLKITGNCSFGIAQLI